VKTTFRLAAAGTVLAFCVVVLGAWVRLTDAGLGCPDWPGCYGHFAVPGHEVAAERFPDRPLDPGKAWREMTHRYAAGTLGLLVLALAVVAVRNRRTPGQPVALPLVLLALVCVQAWLGQLTVTLLLEPIIVMAHLLGGLATLSLLAWLALETRPARPASPVAEAPALRRMALAALVVLVVQIALGGWTSSHYAALACTDFPTCHGSWWPDADFRDAFVPWRPIDVDHTGGTLDHPARIAIHLTHRIGAALTFIVAGFAAAAVILRARHPAPRGAAACVLAALVTQVALGVAMVKLGLPLYIAVAHNATAALLLLSVVTMNHLLRRAP
jgi:cytochrome c oxidase assembly protein subunit 15